MDQNPRKFNQKNGKTNKWFDDENMYRSWKKIRLQHLEIKWKPNLTRNRHTDPHNSCIYNYYRF